MRRDRDRLVVVCLIAIGTLAVIAVGITLSIGTYVYLGPKGPTPSANQAPGATGPAVGPDGASQSPMYICDAVSDRGSRTYAVNLQLRPGAEPVDMTGVTAKLEVSGASYDVWSLGTGRYEWDHTDLDAMLDPGERFTMIFSAGDAGLPLDVASVRLVIAIDGKPALDMGLTPV